MGCTVQRRPALNSSSIFFDLHWNMSFAFIEINEFFYFLSVGTESFGDYSCRASNQLGSSSSTARVSGLALPADWRTEDSHSPWEDKFFLEWTTFSKSPVESFTLEYRYSRSTQGLHNSKYTLSCTCTVVGPNGTLDEAKLVTLTQEWTHFIFNKCPI